jgi:hypothetical protein
VPRLASYGRIPDGLHVAVSLLLALCRSTLAEQSGLEGVIASVIAGRYTTRRDGGLAYTYDARWQEAGEGIIWSATVRRDGELAGTPSGQIRHIAGAQLADEVRRLVETAIEIRTAVK